MRVEIGNFDSSKVLSYIKEKKYVIVFYLFLLLNSSKIALFNCYMISNKSKEIFIYKLVFTMFIFMIFYSFILKFKSKIPFLLFYTLQILYIIVNIGYYIYFHSYINLIKIFSLFNEGITTAGHFSVPLSDKYFIVLIDLPLFLLVAIYYNEIRAFSYISGSKKIILNVVFLTAILLIECQNFAYGNSVIHYSSSSSSSSSKSVSKGKSSAELIVERYGTVVNNLVMLMGKSSDEEDLKVKLDYGNQIKSGEEKKNRPNFVVIQVESMDSNAVNQKHNGEYVMPYLNQLKENSVYFPYVFSYHMGGGTSDCEFSIINSVEPFEEFPAIKLKNYDYPNSFVRTLADNKYNTCVFHGNVEEFYERNFAFPKMGYLKFFDIRKMNLTDEGWGAPDDKVFKFALSYLKESQEPFYAHVITMTSHTPFTNARNYYNNSRFDDIGDKITANYFNSMAYVDESICDFVSAIKENFDNTYILIYGDHTPNINNIYYSQASIIEENKYFEFVPLFIITPDGKVRTEYKKVASFLDISPTVLYASGVSFSINSYGCNLLDDEANYASIPFKGEFYDREELFLKIKNAVN